MRPDVDLQVAMTEATLQFAHAVLFPLAQEPPGTEHGFIGVVTSSVGYRRRTLLLHSVVEPLAGDVSYDDENGLIFSTAYKSRAADQAATLGAGLIFVHTHPLSRGGPRPSSWDLESDGRDLFFIGGALAANAPLAAAVVGGDHQWSVREYHFLPGARGPTPPHSMKYASAMRVVGPSLRKYDLTGQRPDVEAETTDSTLRLWGRAGQERLAALVVGHPGLGGIGSILAESGARLGEGAMVLLDFDHLTPANTNRQQGADRTEIAAGISKLKVAERLARMAATAPAFALSAIDGSIVEEESVRHLLDCDIILNAADSAWGRQVLDDIAFAHLIPVINGGTQLSGDPDSGAIVAGKSEVAVAGPGHPCLECAGVYTRREASAGREHPDVRGERGYLRGGERAEPERAPSVISANMLVAGLMLTRLQAIVVGTSPAVVGTQRYHHLEGVMDFAVDVQCRRCCPRAAIVALGDLHQLPLGIDLDLSVARAKRSRRAC